MANYLNRQNLDRINMPPCWSQALSKEYSVIELSTIRHESDNNFLDSSYYLTCTAMSHQHFLPLGICWRVEKPYYLHECALVYCDVTDDSEHWVHISRHMAEHWSIYND